MKIKQKFQLPAVTRGMLIGAALAAVIVGGTVTATVYVPPVARPPEGNIPSAIWNSMDSYQHQVQRDAAINIDGGGPGDTVDGNSSGLPVGISVGSSALKMGKNNGGQNLFYGVADRTEMNADDHLMLLQSFNPENSVYENRLAVDGWGNVTVTGDIVTTGQVTSTGCFGSVFVGITDSARNGKVSYGGKTGYNAVNAICQDQYHGDAHVCSAVEMLNSIKCATPDRPIQNVSFNGQTAWINAGPPGFTAAANDCNGWQEDLPYRTGVPADGYYGRIWKFNSVTGGTGFVTTCNSPTKFACCK